jgi:hypothetical protein
LPEYPLNINPVTSPLPEYLVCVILTVQEWQ